MFNASYLAAIEHMDSSIGRLMAALDETQQRENTLVVFLSDNGGVETVYSPPGLIGDPTGTQINDRADAASIPQTDAATTPPMIGVTPCCSTNVQASFVAA